MCAFLENSLCLQEKINEPCKGSNYRYQLEQEVQRLQKQLQEEIDLHLTLANVVEQHDSPIADSPGQLPDNTRELLDSLALLEITVQKLEDELEALQRQLSQERRERHEAEYNSKLSSPHRLSSVFRLANSLTEPGLSPHNAENLYKKIELAEKPNKDLSVENLWQHPNRLSEEMVSCMRDIFLFLSDSSKDASSPQGQLSYNSPASFLASPAKSSPPSSDSETMFNRYKVHGKTAWAGSTGTYSKVIEVSWLSVGRKELCYAAVALKRFRCFVEQLARVNPSYMTHDEKLAFWINLYNALIMHAYLAYGIPRSDIKLFSLMEKATYTVGGHSISAAEIEYIILKMKSPAHRPQIALCLALHKFEGFTDRETYSIDHHEPLLAFALSCGMHSAPAVRIFRPGNVTKQLKESLKDYVQASIGISGKGKILVPKLLHHYAKGLVPDASLLEWICQFVPAERAKMIRDCSSRQKWKFLGTRDFTISPFDSRFRYLFLLN